MENEKRQFENKDKSMKKINKILIPIIGTIAIGSIFVFGGRPDPCFIEINDVTKENLIGKLVEKVEEMPVNKNSYTYGCELEEVEIANIFYKTKGVQYSDKNCKTKNKDEFKEFRNDNLFKMKNLNNFKYNESKQTRKDFEDIWNYHLLESCGFIEN